MSNLETIELQLLEIRNLLMDIRDRLPPPGTFVEVPDAAVCSACGRAKPLPPPRVP